MLGFGWLALWRVEQALRGGRLEEACVLLERSGARNGSKTERLRRRIAAAFVERGSQELEGRRSDAAWKDLLKAERLLPNLAEAALLRQRLTDHGASLAGDSLLLAQPLLRERGPRFLLWIDGIGGYLVCQGDAISLGRSTPDAGVDVPLLADVSRLHAHLIRDAEGYVIEAVRPIQVNNKPVQRAMLHDSDRVTLGTSFQFLFHQPVPLSASARMDIVSGHRLSLAVDAVLLMGDALVLGDRTQSHVQSPDLGRQVVLFRSRDGLGVRLAGDFRVNGQPCKDRVELQLPATVSGDNIAFSLEWASP
jgi:hypothetical protein